MSKINALLVLLLSGLIFVGFSLVSCSDDGGGAKSRKKTTSESTTDTDGLVTEQSLSSCQSKGKAWIAVVNGGESPATCEGTLVEWCCKKTEIYARFPTIQKDLDTVFKKNVDEDGYILYACSQANSATSLHFGKISNGSKFYRNADLTQVFPQEIPDDGSECPEITESDLIPESETTTEDTTDDSATEGAQ